MKKKTVGVSPKAYLGAFFAAVGALATLLITRACGADHELASALTVVAAPLFAFAGAYFGDPSPVVNE